MSSACAFAQYIYGRIIYSTVQYSIILWHWIDLSYPMTFICTYSWVLIHLLIHWDFF